MDKIKLVGCYYCMKIFDKATITDWCDKGRTPICPHCGIDSITENTHELSAMREKAFAVTINVT